MPSTPFLRPSSTPRNARTRQVAAIFAGGLVGSGAREGVAHLLPAASGDFPSAVLAVNLIGSLCLGWYLARRERSVSAQWSPGFWAIGVFGSFTTFSAFSFDVVRLLETGRAATAGGYVVASMVGGLALAMAGQRIGRVA